MKNHVALHLSLIKGVGPVCYKRLKSWLCERNRSFEELYHFSVQDFCVVGFTREHAERLRAGLADTRMLHDELALLTKHNVTLVVEGEEGYPPMLSAIHAPPIVLYVQGDVKSLSKCAVACVGSREAQAYGKAVVEHIIPPLVADGYAVVSGGARGIDAYAHTSALSAQGITIAVFGSGLLKPYPYEHKRLFARIVEQGGALVSSFPLQTTAMPGNFPARNRIIAGLSAVCIVVQAAARSGALITASYALQEGREVGVVPGSIFDALSQGCHKLLAEGATPICSADDVRTLLGDETRDVQRISQPVNSVMQDELSAKIQAACYQPCSFDDLLSTTSLTPEQLYDELWQLQIAGSIEQTATGLWKNIG